MKAQATILQFILLFALSVALFSFLTFFMYSYYSNFRKELSKELTELLGSIFLNHFVYLSKECDCGENFYLERSFSTFNLSISPTRLALSEMALNLELPIYRFLSSPKLHNLNYTYSFLSAKENYLFDVKGKKFSLLHNKTHLILDEFPPSFPIYIFPPEVKPPTLPPQPPPTYPFLPGFNYRRLIFIQENSGNDLIDYQVSVNLGVIGAWSFDEGSGDYVYDSVGNDLTGIIYDAKWVEGKYGYALEFGGSGTSERVEFGNPELLHFDSEKEYTWSAWIKLYEVGRKQVIFAKYESKESGYHIAITETNKLAFQDAKNWEGVYGSPILTANKWYHIAVTYNNGTVKLYINGELDESGNVSATSDTTNPFLISTPYSSEVFNGIIDEPRFFNRSLTDAEIKLLFNNFEDIRFTDSDGTTLLSYWKEADGKFWVKVNVSASSTKTIYMYYGNFSVRSASNGTRTFIFFDDFNSFDRTKWYGYRYSGDTTNELSIENGVIYLTKAVNYKGGLLVSRDDIIPPFIVKFRYKAGGGSGADGMAFGYLMDVPTFTSSGGDLGFWPGSYGYLIQLDNYKNPGDPYGRYIGINDINDGIKGDVDGSAYQTSATEDNKWHIIEAALTEDEILWVKLDGVTIISSDTTPASTGYYKIGLGAGTGAWHNNHIVDYIYLRKYASPEPSVSIGEEETLK